MRLHVGPRGLGLLVGVGLVLSIGVGCSDDAAPNEGKAGSSGEDDVTWCEVSVVLQEKCERCHGSPPSSGAPFPLVSYDDTQVESSGHVRWERMQDMVEHGLMPPPGLQLEPPAEKPTKAERELLLAWFDQGARPVGGTDCD